MRLSEARRTLARPRLSDWTSSMDPLRVGLITTLDRNIGDDFIRDGIIQILCHVFAGRSVEFLAINKHVPLTVYPDWHPLRWLQGLDRLPRGRRAAQSLRATAGRALFRLGGSRFDGADVIVQCGAPVMWPGCHSSEFAEPLWDQVVGRLSEHVAVLNLAAGSCYPWEAQPELISDPSDSEFLRRILRYSDVTTARDELASRLAHGLGTQVHMIPCSAFLVGRRFPVPSTDDGGMVLFNYMPGGGHYDWGQDINERSWMEAARSLVERLASRHRVAFVCHDAKEYAAAKDLNPDLPRFMPTTIEDYFSLIANSKAALCNRLHAAVALGGIGIPSVSVGTDTRLLMVAAIGLPFRYVKDVVVDELEEQFEEVLKNRRNERERLIELREWTWARYADEVSKGVAA